MATTNNRTNTSIIPGLTLQQQNDEEFDRRLAPVIYLAVLMVVGIPGNLLVLVVYFRHFTRSTHRTCILCLAAVDLSICLVCLPFEIFEMRFQYTFYNEVVCKLFRTNNTFLSTSSILMILCMSINRYRRVCRPLRTQMTPRVSLFYCLGALVVSLVFAWPNSIISGIKTVPLKHNITGSDCSLSDQFAKTIYPIAYGGVLLIIFLIVTTFLIIMYSLIGRKVHKQSKLHKKLKSPSCSGMLTNSPADPNNGNDSKEKNTSANEPEVEQVNITMTSPAVKLEGLKHTTKMDSSSRETICTYSKQTETAMMSPSTKPEVTISTTKNIFSNRSSQRNTNVSKSTMNTLTKDNRTRTIRTTRITFLISLVFILSYLPHLILVLTTALMGGSIAQPGLLTSAVLPIVSRSVYINNVANPFIYGFWDPKFRENCIKVFKMQKANQTR